MEGLAVSKEIIGLATSIGVIPTVIIFAVCMFFIIREIKKQNQSLQDGLSNLRSHSDAQDKKITESLEKFNDELQYIEKNYVTKEQHYSDFEGWRAEIKDLRDLITQFLIAGGLKNGKN